MIRNLHLTRPCVSIFRYSCAFAIQDMGRVAASDGSQRSDLRMLRRMDRSS
jgi:hypothetical protein